MTHSAVKCAYPDCGKNAEGSHCWVAATGERDSHNRPAILQYDVPLCTRHFSKRMDATGADREAFDKLFRARAKKL
jgi:hypothetical protein